MTGSRSLEHTDQLVRVGVSLLGRSERARQERSRRALAAFVENAGRPARPASPKAAQSDRIHAGWSAQSRRTMLLTFSCLDLSPMLRPGAVLTFMTLTLPGGWEKFAPTGPAWAKLLKRFFDRLDRAWPGAGALLVKTEYQKRKAPHAHILLGAPAGTSRFGRGKASRVVDFRAWVTLSWADVVGAVGTERVLHEAAGTQVRPWRGDPGTAVAYFAKYVSKSGEVRDHQDEPPTSWLQPGCGLARVWSYRGLSRAIVEHTLSQVEVQWAQRIVRRYVESQRRTKRVRVARGGRRRSVRRRVRVLHHARGGWVVLPNAARIASLADRAARIAAAGANERD